MGAVCARSNIGTEDNNTDVIELHPTLKKRKDDYRPTSNSENTLRLGRRKSSIMEEAVVRSSLSSLASIQQQPSTVSSLPSIQVTTDTANNSFLLKKSDIDKLQGNFIENQGALSISYVDSEEASHNLKSYVHLLMENTGHFTSDFNSTLSQECEDWDKVSDNRTVRAKEGYGFSDLKDLPNILFLIFNLLDTKFKMSVLVIVSKQFYRYMCNPSSHQYFATDLERTYKLYFDYEAVLKSIPFLKQLTSFKHCARDNPRRGMQLTSISSFISNNGKELKNIELTISNEETDNFCYNSKVVRSIVTTCHGLKKLSIVLDAEGLTESAKIICNSKLKILEDLTIDVGSSHQIDYRQFQESVSYFCKAPFSKTLKRFSIMPEFYYCFFGGLKNNDNTWLNNISSSFINLESISLNTCNINDFSSILRLDKLKYIFIIVYNTIQIENITAIISTKKSLKEVNISNKTVVEICNSNCNQIIDVSHIGKLTLKIYQTPLHLFNCIVPYITTLYIKENEVSEKCFEYTTTRLKKMVLDKCTITNPGELFLRLHASQLSQFHIYNCSWSGNQSVIPFHLVTSLYLLKVVSTPLGQLPEELDKLNLLGYLELKSTGLTELPSSISNLGHLYYLDLSYNQLTSIPKSLKNLTNLIYMNVTHNNLETITNFATRKSSINIESALHLEANKLQDLPKKFNLLSVENIYLNDNLFSYLPTVLYEIETITVLNLSNNQLKQLNSDIGKLVNLQELYLNNNPLENLPSLRSCKKLRIIDCSNCKITQWPDLNSLTFLQKALFPHNSLTEIPTFDSGTLQVLDFSHNKIEAPCDTITLSQQWIVANNPILLRAEEAFKTDSTLLNGKKEHIFLPCQISVLYASIKKALGMFYKRNKGDLFSSEGAICFPEKQTQVARSQSVTLFETVPQMEEPSTTKSLLPTVWLDDFTINYCCPFSSNFYVANFHVVERKLSPEEEYTSHQKVTFYYEHDMIRSTHLLQQLSSEMLN
ncbi:hypothetical protein ABK040_007548 [Willaertia magna]